MEMVTVLRTAMLCFLASIGSAFEIAQAQSASNWILSVYTKGGSIGSSIGVAPWGSDALPTGSLHPPTTASICLLTYYNDGTSLFAGGEVRKSPVPAGGNHTWSGFYLWAFDRTPSPANLIVIEPESEFNLPPPAGYRGHLVLDYVPDSCNWTGDRDFWLDLTADNEFALPIPVVADPLLGTRFHLDVYAPVPEPSSLAALACGLAGVGGVAMKRRRHGSGA